MSSSVSDVPRRHVGPSGTSEESGWRPGDRRCNRRFRPTGRTPCSGRTWGVKGILSKRWAASHESVGSGGLQGRRDHLRLRARQRNRRVYPRRIQADRPDRDGSRCGLVRSGTLPARRRPDRARPLSTASSRACRRCSTARSTSSTSCRIAALARAAERCGGRQAGTNAVVHHDLSRARPGQRRAPLVRHQGRNPSRTGGFARRCTKRSISRSWSTRSWVGWQPRQR